MTNPDIRLLSGQLDAVFLGIPPLKNRGRRLLSGQLSPPPLAARALSIFFLLLLGPTSPTSSPFPSSPSSPFLSSPSSLPHPFSVSLLHLLLLVVTVVLVCKKYRICLDVSLFQTFLFSAPIRRGRHCTYFNVSNIQIVRRNVTALPQGPAFDFFCFPHLYTKGTALYLFQRFKHPNCKAECDCTSKIAARPWLPENHATTVG